MKIRLASILALAVCFVFSAAEQTFAVGEFDNFRQADAFRFNLKPNANFRANDRFDIRFGNCGVVTLKAKDFDAFAGDNFVKFVDNSTLNSNFNNFDGSRGSIKFNFLGRSQRDFDRTGNFDQTASRN